MEDESVELTDAISALRRQLGEALRADEDVRFLERQRGRLAGGLQTVPDPTQGEYGRQLGAWKAWNPHNESTYVKLEKLNLTNTSSDTYNPHWTVSGEATNTQGC
jgi:hypothetical protein